MAEHATRPAVVVVEDGTSVPPLSEMVRRSAPSSAVGRVRSLGALESTPSIPGVVVVEVGSTKRLLQLVDRLRTQDLRTVVVSSLAPQVALVPVLAAGGRGFLLRSADEGAIAHAVDAVAAGWTWIDPRCTELLVDLAVRGPGAVGPDGLTARQAQMVALLRVGLARRDIARALGVSADTVKVQLHEAARRLGTDGRGLAAVRPTGPHRPQHPDVP